MDKLKNQQTVESDKHSFSNLCSTCKKSCCTNFAAPLVFPNDMEKLKKIGKASEQYLMDVMISGKSVKKIKKTSGTTNCVFWDQNNGCTIYAERPFDCKMFPFDIEPIGDEYFWIVYTCNLYSDWTWSEKHLQELEKNLLELDYKNLLEIISKSPVSGSELISYKILRKINLPYSNKSGT